ncbi:PadR family transcriptional regulator [Slackia heliotrinireducens]|uniref:PadR family transcriptional regulator n=1 Tax=Slackia heliotrinireducens TaxID=84110 RepID=UPI003315A81E
MQLDYVMLGLIRMNPHVSGYRLKTVVNNSIGFIFTVHNSQIYPTLKRLKEKGYLVSELIPQENKPSMKCYTITESGLKTLNEWLTERFKLEWTHSAINTYFMKLMLMGHLEMQTIIDYIDWGIDEVGNHLARTQATDADVQGQSLASDTDDAKLRSHIIWSCDYAYTVDDMRRRLDELKEVRTKLQSLGAEPLPAE